MLKDRLQRDLEGFRCRFQRLSDAKLFNGWVYKANSKSFTIQSDPDLNLVIDQLFSFEVYGQERRLAFEAKLQETGIGFYDFVYISEATYFQASEAHRLVAKDIHCSVDYNDEVIECDVIDISPNGLGVRMERHIPRLEILKVRIETPVGYIECDGQIKYCRAVKANPGTYRVGLEILIDDRVGRGRWVRTLSGASAA